MSDEAWVFSGLLVTQLAGIAIVWLKARGAQRSAAEAARLSLPTGNGWAKEIRESLVEIREDLKVLRDEARDDRKTLTIHLQDHVRGGRSRMLRVRG